MDDKPISYCKKCILNNGDKDTIIDENGFCNSCNNSDFRKYTSTYKKALANAKQYEEYLETHKNDMYYNSLLMLSGGKDSIYMLYKLLTDKKARILAYTFNHPFESKSAAKNIKTVLSKLTAEHFEYTPNSILYKKILRHTFTKDNIEPLKYGFRARFPCITCSNYMRLSALTFAYRMGIPYVLYCADPVQMVSFESDTKQLIMDFIHACGEELYKQLPEKILIDEMMSFSSDKLPKMVFPYATVSNYNAANIIKELKELELYESSPRQTHCSLYPLLNYYSIKRFNTLFYEREMAGPVRSGEIPRQQTLDSINAIKHIFLDITTKEHLSPSDKSKISELISVGYHSSDELEHELNDIVSLKKIADDLELDLNDI